MKVKVKKTHPDAVIPFKKYDKDFCYDCVAVSCEEIAPYVYKYSLGLAFQIDRSDENPLTVVAEKDGDMGRFDPWQLSVDFRPRSSIWEHGMSLCNATGTVDELFTGETSVIFYHVLPNMPKYEVGDKVCQAKIGFTLPVEFVEVDELEPTERGSNGFGSTGR